jgi:hypothetical protein
MVNSQIASRSGKGLSAGRPAGEARLAPLASDLLRLGLVLIAVLAVLGVGGWRVAAFLTPWSDLASYHLPKYRYAAERLAAGTLPLWNPYEFGGIPFLASLQPGVLYPPVALFYTLSSGETAHVGFFLLHLGIAAVATLLMMRSFGCGPWPSILAALWVTQPLWLVRTYDHPNFIATVCWIPLLLLLLRRCVLAPSLRAATALAIVAGLQFLAGYPPITFATAYLLVLSLPFWVLEARSGARPGHLSRAVLALGIAGAVCAAIVAAQLLPTIELAALTDREGAARAAHERWMALGENRYESFFLIGMPQMTYGAAAVDFWSSYGPAPAALGVAALALAWRAPAVWFLLVAIVLSGLLTYPAYTRLPLYGHVRWALEWHLIAPQMVFALAGFGLQALSARGWLRARRLWAWTGVIALLGAVWSFRVVDAAWLRPQETAPMPIPDWVVRHCGLYDPRFRAFWGDGQSRGSLFAARIESIGGYDQSLLPARTSRVIDAIGIGNGFASPNWDRSVANKRSVVSRMALRCLLTTPSPALDGAGFAAFAPPGSPLKAYTNPDALPRARLARRVQPVSSPDAALDHLLSSGEGETVVLEGSGDELPDDACVERDGDAVITLDEAEEVRVQTNASCPSYLVLADTHLPGWTASVDGLEAPVRTADYLFRAVRLPPGRHEVVFRYAPWTVRVGSTVSLVGVALAVALLALPGRRDPLRPRASQPESGA